MNTRLTHHLHSNHYFHISHYIVLAGILASGLLFFFFFQGLPVTQFRVSLVFCVLYFIWGIAHHRLEGDLHPKIVVEYLLISVFALLLLRGAIFR